MYSKHHNNLKKIMQAINRNEKIFYQLSFLKNLIRIGSINGRKIWIGRF